MQIECIADDAGFDRLADEWDPLLAASVQRGPFLRYAWLRAWWDEFGDGKRLCILTCRDPGGALAGVFPLWASRTGRAVRARTLRFLGDAGVGSTGLSAFAKPGREDEVFSAFTERLRVGAPAWDVLELRYLDQSHGFVGHLSEGRSVRVRHDCDPCPRAALATDWDSYLARLSKHMRHEVRRSLRRVAERGLTFETVRERDELDGAMTEFFSLHEQRMREKYGDGFGLSHAYRSFMRRAAEGLFNEGLLRLHFLAGESGRCAVLFMLRYGDAVFAVQSGFADEARQDGQRALWGHALRSAIEEGCTEVDMLLGDQRYKRDWGVTEVRALSAMRVYNRTIPGLARSGRDGIASWLEQRSSAAEPVPAEAS